MGLSDGVGMREGPGVTSIKEDPVVMSEGSVRPQAELWWVW